jgi:endoglucanase
VYSDHVATGTKKKTYHDFAVKQANYTLGDNPNQRSYMVGFGQNPPLNPHHRSAHASWADKITTPEDSRHILYGALVGGPGRDDAYEDNRDDFVMNEVANDYNAAYTGVLARMLKEFGGEPLPNFPQPEVPGPEFEVLAKLNTTGTNFTEISARLLNKTAWPPRRGEGLKMRYFVDLSEVFAAGFKIEDVKLTLGYNQDEAAKGASLIPSGAGPNQYMVEIDFTGANIYPGGQSQHSKEVQFRIGLHAEAPAGSWNAANDPSFLGIQTSATEPALNEKMSVYEAGHKVFGVEAAGTPLLEPRGSGRRLTPIRSLARNELGFSWPRGRDYQIRVRSLNGRLIFQAAGRSEDGFVRAHLPGLERAKGLFWVEVAGPSTSTLRNRIVLQ